MYRNRPNEKKSTAGAADTCEGGRGGALPSSNEILDRPFFKERGKKDTELALESSSSESPFIVKTEAGECDLVRGSSTSSAVSIDTGAADGLYVLNISPSPLPPPRTRSGGAITGTFCLGAGSIESNDDLPAPDDPESNRGFFAAGLSSPSFSLSFVCPGRLGGPIVIFFGPRFDFKGGRDSPLPDGLDGGGRDIEDFFAGGEGGSLDVDGVESLSLSLP